MQMAMAMIGQGYLGSFGKFVAHFQIQFDDFRPGDTEEVSSPDQSILTE